MPDYLIGFVGAGNMAEALCRGVISAGLVPPGRIVASDLSEARRKLFQEGLGVEAVSSNLTVAREAATLVLAVKPQHMEGVLAEIGSVLGSGKLVISIAAGVKIARIEAAAQPGCRVIRCMPNTPMLVGKGMAALAAGRNAAEEDMAFAERLFRCAAEVIAVKEENLDAVTAVSGSGPAYFFYLVEAMTAAGVAEGLDRPLAAKLAAQTLLGAGHLAAASSDSAEELRRKVTSPGGTTEAAVRVLDGAQVKNAIVDAVRAAARRSQELSGG
jgi:pyrroline-5-carboxylate reductase